MCIRLAIWRKLTVLPQSEELCLVFCSGPLLPASAGSWPASSHGEREVVPFFAVLVRSLLTPQRSGTSLWRTDGEGQREDEGAHRPGLRSQTVQVAGPSPRPTHLQIYHVTQTRIKLLSTKKPQLYHRPCYQVGEGEPRRMQ